MTSPQHKTRRLNRSSRPDHRVAVQDEILHCPCGVTIKKASYHRHRYTNDQHVEYIIYLCMVRDSAIDALEKESLKAQRDEAAKLNKDAADCEQAMKHNAVRGCENECVELLF